MANSIIVSVCISAVLGYLAGIGVGGGSLLMLWLTLVLNTEYEKARIINLMFFLAAAGTVSLFRWKQGTVPIKELLPAIIGGCAASAAVTAVSSGIDTQLLSKAFGILLTFTGIRELFYRTRKAR